MNEYYFYANELGNLVGSEQYIITHRTEAMARRLQPSPAFRIVKVSLTEDSPPLITVLPQTFTESIAAE